MENFWTHCLERFKKELSAQQFNTWIKPLRFEHDQDKIKILAPNKFVQQWVKDRFAQKIELLAKELLPQVTKVEFAIRAIKESILPKKEAVLSKALAISPQNNVADAPPHEPTKKSAGGPLKDVKASGLNTQFTFKSFVTGKANQLACAAAMQVAENPGKAYNPLFIYGGVGLGKTHLIQAIGNHLKHIQPDAKIKYLHAERYVSDVVKAYENKAFDAFKKNYHSLDLLLIDDIQFFSKKNRTQEEFFYAFNALIENKKQIIITCDSYPKEIEGVDERLRTRFSWGLTVAIEPPELEMRVAILLKKAEENKMKINWVPLNDELQLSAIIKISSDKPVLIFKHSTRCSISRMALKQFEREYDLEGVVDAYFLDLITYRDISNEIASRFGVHHESPQLILIKNGKAVYNVSHSDIDAEALKSKV